MLSTGLSGHVTLWSEPGEYQCRALVDRDSGNKIVSSIDRFRVDKSAAPRGHVGERDGYRYLVFDEIDIQAHRRYEQN